MQFSERLPISSVSTPTEYKKANKPKMATPLSGLVEFPFWWFNPAMEIGTPP
jgi:hypothetical protein